MVRSFKKPKDQWNRIESPKVNLHIYGRLIYDKDAKNIQWRKENLFNKCCWKNWTDTRRRMKLDHYLTACTNINSKRIKDMNTRLETIKLLEANIDNKLLDLGHGNNFLDLTSRAKATKNKNKQVKLHHAKMLLHSKANIQQNKKAIYSMRENICKSYILQGVNIQNM